MTVTLLTMWDSAYPDSTDPNTAAELVYAGGDTPNPQYVVTGRARYRVPCWVRSNPQTVHPVVDADAFLSWLAAQKVPSGVYTWLDLETTANPAWVTSFGQTVNAAGFKVSPYGSYDTVVGNPMLDGYATAHYNGTPHICATGTCGVNVVGAVATQYADSTMLGTSYDLSLIAANPLWDTMPAPTPQPSETRMKVAIAAGVAVGATKPGTSWLVFDNALKYVIEDPVDIAAWTAAVGALDVSCGFLNNIPNMV